MDLTHLGHACVLVTTATTRVLIDPGTLSAGFEDLQDLDAVLVTHQHADHVDAPRVRRLLESNPRAKLVLDEGTVGQFAGIDCTVARPGDRLRYGADTISVLGGMHAPVHGDVPGCPNLAYLVNDGEFLHPGDSLHVPDVPVDTLAVPVGGPWIKLGDAVDYVLSVRPATVLAIHEGELTDPAKYVGMLHHLVERAGQQPHAPRTPHARTDDSARH